jgi:dihydroorotase
MRENLPIITAETIPDLHVHLREDSEEGLNRGGSIVAGLLKLSAQGGADVLGAMPNTTVPLTTAQRVMEYYRYALSLAPRDKVNCLVPIVMLTEETTHMGLQVCRAAGIKDGKIYPHLRTTKAEHGVRHWGRMLQVVRGCGEFGIRVHGHFEDPSPQFSNRDAELACVAVARMFLEESDAVIVWEHGSDGRCVPHWKEMAKTGRFFVTITAHHLAANEDTAYGDVRAVCKPTIKTELDRLALVALVKENLSWVMAASDSAAHDIKAKHVHQGQCACGALTAPFLALLYAHTLSPLLQIPAGRETFLNFTSRNTRRLYGLPPGRPLPIVASPFEIPLTYSVGPWTVEPFWAGKTLDYNFAP